MISRYSIALVSLLFAMLSFGPLSRSASGSTLTVPGQYKTIQAAINAAVNGDTVLIADGTYTGPGNVDVDFGGKNITVTSQNGAATTIIDCQGTSTVSHRGFTVHSGETNAIISGFTIEDGYENGNSQPAIEGAGVYDYNAGLTIRNCILKNNTCAYGGGIYIDNADAGKATVTNCLLSGNSAGYGGGIYGYNESSGTITATGCTLTGNSGATSGGGFYNINNTGGTITIFGCLLSNNSAPNAPTNGISGGGGIFNGNSGGTVTIADCALTSNSTLAWGGGLNNANTSGTATVIGCTFTANNATFGSGGGVYVSGGLNLTDDIIYGDTNGEVTGGYPTVNYCDVKGGYSGNGNINADPLFTLSPTDLHLVNGSPCIGTGTASNTLATTLDGRARPNPPSIGAYELDSRLQTTTALSSSLNPSNPGQSVAFTASVTGGGIRATGTVIFTVDGTTQATVPLTGAGTAVYTTSSLSAGAHLIQAIYSGDANLTPSKSAVLTQTNGLAFTAITISSSLNPAVAGQYVTFQATLTNSGSGAVGKPTGTVTFTVDGTAAQTAALLSGRYANYTTSSLSVGSHTVAAIYNGDANFAASTSPALTQSVPPHVSPQYVSQSGRDTNSGAQAAPKLTIQAAINSTLPGDIVIVEDGTYTGPGNVDLDFGGVNLTVTSQNGAASTIIDCSGNTNPGHRGFYLHYGETSAVIRGFTIQNGQPYGPGGGIYNACKGLTVQYCTVKNSTSSGNGGGIYNSGTLTVTNCTIAGNSAVPNGNTSTGGGIDNDSGNLTILNSTITGNYANGGGEGAGGGICNSAYATGQLTMVNCVVAYNVANYGTGGGLFSSTSNGSNTVTNCTFTGNSASDVYTNNGGGVSSYVSSGSTLSLVNDIFYGDTGGGELTGTYSTSVSNCDVQGGYKSSSTNIDADPLFFSASDFHLQAGSPCLGAGSSNAPSTTIDGRTRPSPPSIGAYEAGVTGSSAAAITLLSNINPAIYGQSVSFTTTITAASGIPTGTVTVFSDGVSVGHGAISNGTATVATNVLAGGTHQITATYSGDAAFAPAKSAALTQTVTPAASTTTLTSSYNPSSLGYTISFTASVAGTKAVAGNIPAGTIVLTDSASGIVYGSGVLSAGTVLITVPNLPGGTHQLVASYSGDMNNSASASAPLAQIVKPATATLYFASSVNPSLSSQPVTFTANVGGTGAVPTGTVIFTVDGTAQPPVTTGGPVSAAYTTSMLSVGSHTITASYSGDNNFLPIAPSSLTQVVLLHVNPQYVSPFGSDSNPGTQAAPKLTIQAAINSTLDGDLVIVTDGTYTGPGDVDLYYGGRNITVTSLNGAAKTIIDCGGSTSSNGTISHRGFVLGSGETHAVISGLTIENGYEPTSGFNSASGGGICSFGSILTVQNCILKNNTAYSGGGIYGASINGGYNPGISNVTVINCLFIGNSAPFGSGLFVSEFNGTSTVTNCTFTGNTSANGSVYNDNNSGGYLYLFNTILYGDIGGEITLNTVGAFYSDVQGGFGGIGDINADPLFVSTSDFHLQAGSPCLGTGAAPGAPGIGTAGAPTTTIDGRTRPNPPSIGAYEVYLAPTFIVVTNVSGTAGQTVTLSASLNPGTRGLPGATLQFSVDGTIVGTAVTGDNSTSGGPARLSYTIPVGFAPGSHTITAAFGGDATDSASSGIGTLTVSVSPASLINDTDSGFTYTGTGWKYYPGRGTGDVNGDVHATQNNGDAVSFSFLGSSLSVLSETNADEGTVDVSIDGVFQQTVNCYTATRLGKQTIFSASGLTPGVHVLKLVKTSGTYMLLDALQATPAPSTSSLINDSGGGIGYTGAGWGYYANRGAGDFADDVHATTVNGDAFSYTFTGTSISYLTETNSDEGNVQVYLDNALQATVSAYSTSRASQKALWNKSGLASGTHTLKVVKQNGQYMLVDALQVSPALPSSTQINDADSGITYTGSDWIYLSGRSFGDVSSDVHAATANGSSVSYTFTGSAISWLTETNTDEGSVQVYVDGILQATVSCVTSSRQVQQIMYSTSGLTAGSHTLKLVKTSGSYLVVDAFRIQ